MLTKLVVSTYGLLIEISLWLFLIGCIGTGWYFGGFFGAMGAAIVSFLFAVMFFGAFVILADIRSSVRAIEAGNAI